MQTLELCRIIGILLDNAIEAAELSNDKIINVALVSNNNVKVIIVKNSYNGEKPNINLIFKEGYSTKNNNSGLGLKILKDIANKQRNIILDTRIDENYFTQIINIY
nr:GHKL domain-containing protein [Clostridium chrysemydis]